ncbi:hypothetical protein [Alloacidobacterium dinghuense]|uniref:hypothetical protein n=1 Tax=Alloacidobacterium dinghuense TaxID=2763107 RepID=UPI003D8003ED
MQLLTRVRTAFGVDLSLQQLFDASAVHGIASVIRGNHGRPQKENLNGRQMFATHPHPAVSRTQLLYSYCNLPSKYFNPA